MYDRRPPQPTNGRDKAHDAKCLAACLWWVVVGDEGRNAGDDQGQAESIEGTPHHGLVQVDTEADHGGHDGPQPAASSNHLGAVILVAKDTTDGGAQCLHHSTCGSELPELLQAHVQAPPDEQVDGGEDL